MTIQPASTGRAWTRADHLSRLYLDHDVVVIGGGVVGAGVALDAITRGLSVLLIDRDDFASGTSSRSTKLFHGGVRYLPQFRFGLVREGLQEQHVLAHIADYLTEPFDFVMPIYKGRGFADAPKWVQLPVLFPIAVRLGLWFYDRLGGRHNATGKRKIDVAEVKREVTAMLEAVKARRPSFDYEVRDLFEVQPTMTDRAAPVVGATARAVQTVLGAPPGFVVSPGTYDQKHIDRIGRLKNCIAYGPGRLELAHQPDEWIDIDEMSDAALVMALSVADLLGR